MIQTKTRTQRLLAVILGLTVAGLAACSKINKENYDKLKMGMDYPEVVKLLGEPTKCDGLLGAKSCTWGEAPKTIKIQLVADKVILFESEGL
jgi:hypothetical protein